MISKFVYFLIKEQPFPKWATSNIFIKYHKCLAKVHIYSLLIWFSWYSKYFAPDFKSLLILTVFFSVSYSMKPSFPRNVFLNLWVPHSYLITVNIALHYLFARWLLIWPVPDKIRVQRVRDFLLFKDDRKKRLARPTARRGTYRSYVVFARRLAMKLNGNLVRYLHSIDYFLPVTLRLYRILLRWSMAAFSGLLFYCSTSCLYSWFYVNRTVRSSVNEDLLGTPQM